MIKLTKWASYRFSDDQKRARSFWRRAQEQESRLMDALMISFSVPDRQDLHAKLDKRIDEIERLRKRATESFPEVAESFTIAKGSL